MSAAMDSGAAMEQEPFDLCNPSQEHRELRNAVAAFAVGEIGPQASEYDHAERFNLPLFRRLGAELGIFGLTVPAEHGGAGLDAVAEVIVHEEMSRFDAAFTLSYLAHEVLFVNNLFVNASPAQLKRYLPGVLSGEKVGAMGMTEPSAGTDVLGLRTVAARKGDRYILNGAKQFITNGPEADFLIVYAKLDHAERREITSFIVESSWKGFAVGKKEQKMGMKASSTATLFFEDLEVPAENMLSAENGGLTSMMRNLEIERVSLAAQSLGIASRCMDEMARYALQERRAFGKALSEFGQVQRLLADSYADYRAARALVYETARSLTPQARQSLSAAAAKLCATQMAERVARNAIQVLGGYGYTREYPVERMLRDAILLSIGGGTNEAMQKNIVGDLRRLYATGAVG